MKDSGAYLCGVLSGVLIVGVVSLYVPPRPTPKHQPTKVKTQLERFMTVTVDIEGRKHTFIFVDDKIFEHPRSCKGCNVGLPYVEVSR